MTQDPSLTELSISELLLPGWDAASPHSHYWIRCHQMWLVAAGQLEENPLRIPADDALLVLMYGRPAYQHAGDLRLQEDQAGQVEMHLDAHGPRQAALGHYSLIIVPYRDNEAAVLERLAELAAVASMELGRNAVAEVVFDNIVTPATSQTMSLTPAVSAPQWFGRPQLLAEHQARFLATEERLAQAEVGLSGRIRLAMRWYQRSFDDDHIDALLSAWVALETLAIPAGQTSINHLLNVIADAYGCTKAEAIAEFRVGHIYRLRGDIMHNGARPALHARLLTFLQALIADIVHHLLGIPITQTARAVLLDPATPANHWHPGA